MAVHDIDAPMLIQRADNGTWAPTDQKDTDIPTQLVISLTLGLSGFITFCFLRPRWSTLYAARKKQLDSAALLPDLPKTFFGWIPVLWGITDEQVLASAGLDAFVFLSFFKMAIRFLSITSVLTVGVLMPIHLYFYPSGPTREVTFSQWALRPAARLATVLGGKGKDSPKLDDSYLSAYFVFVYLFTGLAVYMLLDQSKKVLAVRQRYLGNRVTVTDRTIRLSGVSRNLQSEAALKEYMEGLGIGKVDSVTVCRNWAELDRLMDQRRVLVRKLEEVYTDFNRRQKIGNLETLPVVQAEPFLTLDEEARPLLNGGPRRLYKNDRPKIKIHYGFLKLRSKMVDAIDYYTVRLQALDKEVLEARQKEYEPTPIAFVTMESVASAQVAIQAVLDPHIDRMMASQAPAPPSIVWRNTYRSRTARRVSLWGISILVSLFSVIWLIPVTALAGLLNVRDIRRVWPGLADLLERNDIASSLVRNTLPTAVLTLLSLSVPYCYEWFSNRQGHISRGDVELSLISKNFFFTFFNLFFAFTTLGTAFTFNTLWERLKGQFSDTTLIAFTLAGSLSSLASFYVNLVILQGIGMFPLRLLQFGSVALYPVTYVSAKTPRDFAELVRPSTFSYGFYLPQPMLILIICIVYSVLPSGGQITVFGLIYFVLGYFTYKYQLLYAMDHPQHSTGQAWSIIFYRVILGLIVFQLAMAGFLAINKAFVRSLLIVPLLLLNVWLAWMFSHLYVPLNKFIALKAVNRSMERRAEAGDEERERGMMFVNPNLVVPLEDAWLVVGATERRAES